MTKWTCGMPEWAEEEDCPIDTGEIEECAECAGCQLPECYSWHPLCKMRKGRKKRG